MGRLPLPRALRTDLYDLTDPGSREVAAIDRAVRYLRPLLWWWFRPTVRGLEHVPERPCLFVCNHNAALLMPEIYVLGVSLYERYGPSAVPYGLGHELGLRLPLLHGYFAPLGVLCGTPEMGLELLREKHNVLVCPGGELDSMRSYRDRARVIFGKNRGYVRLALRASVPIVPVVTSGAHETFFVLDDGRWLASLMHLDRLLKLKTWPTVVCLPWGLWIGVPPPHFPLRTRLVQEILEPVEFAHAGDEASKNRSYVEACHHRVHGAMESALRRLSKERHRKEER